MEFCQTALLDLSLPVLSDWRTGVGQAQEDLHVPLLFRVTPDAGHEALDSAVLRLIQGFQIDSIYPAK